MTTRDNASAPTVGGFLRRRHLAVHGLALVLGGLWVAVVFAAGSFLTVASPSGGWFYAALCFLPGLVGTARLGGVRRWRDTLVLASVTALALGWVMYLQAPPDHARIAAKAEDAGLPVPGWQLVDVSESGNTWCFKGCPQVEQLYTTQESPSQSLATLDRILADEGWTGGPAPSVTGRDGPSDYDPLARGRWHRGRWSIELWVPPPASRYGWSLEAAQRGETPVRVTIGGGS